MAEKDTQPTGMEVPIVTREVFDSARGESFGGQSDILVIKENEAAGPFTYAGHQQMTTDLGETTVHLGTLPDGKHQIRLPISATFLRAVDMAKLNPNDTFYVLREDDTIKKGGKGKGQSMPVYKVKVTSRVKVMDKPF
jgi:hypothetical protein